MRRIAARLLRATDSSSCPTDATCAVSATKIGSTPSDDPKSARALSRSLSESSSCATRGTPLIGAAVPSARKDATSGASFERSSNRVISAAAAASESRLARASGEMRIVRHRTHAPRRTRGCEHPLRITQARRGAALQRIQRRRVHGRRARRTLPFALGGRASEKSEREQRDGERRAADLRQEDRPPIHVARAASHPRRCELSCRQSALVDG